jgi:outer membrane scaffolding protein for murein synthesis (MipA/OmpV family)
MTKLLIRLMWSTALATLWATSARAEPMIPLPSVPSIAEADGWAIALGAAGEYEAKYDGSDDYDFEFDPVIAAQWRRGNHVVFLEANELGWRSLQGDRWMIQTGLRYEEGRDEDDADELEGLGDTDDELMAMGEIRRSFGPSWKNWAAARAMAGDSDIGAIGILAAGHRLDAPFLGDGLDVFAFTTFATADFINRDFGVTASQSASSGLPVTDLDGGFRSVGVSAIARWQPGARWQVTAEAGYERYSDDIADSPIARDDYEIEVGVGVTWRFGPGASSRQASRVARASLTDAPSVPVRARTD